MHLPASQCICQPQEHPCSRLPVLLLDARAAICCRACAYGCARARPNAHARRPTEPFTRELTMRFFGPQYPSFGSLTSRLPYTPAVSVQPPPPTLAALTLRPPSSLPLFRPVTLTPSSSPSAPSSASPFPSTSIHIHLLYLSAPSPPHPTPCPFPCPCPCPEVCMLQRLHSASANCSLASCRTPSGCLSRRAAPLLFGVRANDAVSWAQRVRGMPRSRLSPG